MNPHEIAQVFLDTSLLNLKFVSNLLAFAERVRRTPVGSGPGFRCLMARAGRSGGFGAPARRPPTAPVRSWHPRCRRSRPCRPWRSSPRPPRGSRDLAADARFAPHGAPPGLAPPTTSIPARRRRCRRKHRQQRPESPPHAASRRPRGTPSSRHAPQPSLTSSQGSCREPASHDNGHHFM